MICNIDYILKEGGNLMGIKFILYHLTGTTPEQDSAFEESEDDVSSPSRSLDRQSHHRANTTVHVCWHRNTSVSMADHARAVEVSPIRLRISFL